MMRRVRTKNKRSLGTTSIMRSVWSMDNNNKKYLIIKIIFVIYRTRKYIFKEVSKLTTQVHYICDHDYTNYVYFGIHATIFCIVLPCIYFNVLVHYIYFKPINVRLTIKIADSLEVDKISGKRAYYRSIIKIKATVANEFNFLLIHQMYFANQWAAKIQWFKVFARYISLKNRDMYQYKTEERTYKNTSDIPFLKHSCSLITWSLEHACVLHRL